MTHIAELRQQLIKEGYLSEDALHQAEDYAATRKISIEASLLFLNLLNYETLGRALSAVSGMPYAPLLKSSPPDAAKAMIPVALAERRRIFPVSYRKNVLSIAMEASSDTAVRRGLEALFPPPTTLRFYASSRAEIEEAIAVHYKGKTTPRIRELTVPEQFDALIAEHEDKARLDPGSAPGAGKALLLLEPDFSCGRALKTILHAEGYRDVEWAGTPGAVAALLTERPRDLILANALSFPAGGAWLGEISDDGDMPPVSCYHLGGLLLSNEYNYAQMSEALLSLTSFFVRRSAGGDPAQQRQLLAKIRWCRLLALRLRLLPAQVDAVVLAAWLSGLGDMPELLHEVKLPYPMETILAGTGEGENGKGDRIRHTWRGGPLPGAENG